MRWKVGDIWGWFGGTGWREIIQKALERRCGSVCLHLQGTIPSLVTSLRLRCEQHGGIIATLENRWMSMCTGGRMQTIQNSV